MTHTTPTYRLWNSLAPRPGGSRLFSVAAMIRVPYFASLVPHVRRMEPGFAESFTESEVEGFESDRLTSAEIEVGELYLDSVRIDEVEHCS
ncbi:MAG: hypothetical protein QOH57_4972 [Mycobacterium sp.]|jgi:hypothetical protein|nr:hypothetical protein [Mycobacterium sp.]